MDIQHNQRGRTQRGRSSEQKRSASRLAKKNASSTNITECSKHIQLSITRYREKVCRATKSLPVLRSSNNIIVPCRAIGALQDQLHHFLIPKSCPHAVLMHYSHYRYKLVFPGEQARTLYREQGQPHRMRLHSLLRDRSI